MEELYKELIQRDEYLRSLPQSTEVKIRINEITLVIVSLQQKILSRIT